MISDFVKPRHKNHLIYQFTESQKSNNLIDTATFNLHFNTKESLKSSEFNTVNLELASVLKSSSHKRIFKIFRNITIPENESKYYQFIITELVAEWFSSHDSSHVLALKITDSKTGETLPHKCVSMDIENFETVSKKIVIAAKNAVLF